MASPILQFKRGNFSNLPGLQAGEPALTVDKFDLYVGIDSTTGANKLIGSHRYWTRETTTAGSGVNLVEGSNNGSNKITLKAPGSVTSDVTYTLPGAATNLGFLKSDASGNLSWDTNPGSSGVTAISTLDIDGGTDIGADIVDADLLIVDDGAGGTNRKSAASRVKKYIYSAASGDATASDSGAITLAASGVSAGTVGSGSAIPVITVDAKGRVTNTSTASIDTTAISEGNSSVTVDDSGTGTIVAAIDGSTHTTFAAAGITLATGSFNGSVAGATAGTLPLTAVDIDGATATTTVADADLLVIDDGANGTNRKVTATTLKDYFLGGGAGANFTAINVSGITTGGQVDATTLKVSGISTFTGVIDANGALTASGTVTANGAFVANGNVDLGNATSDTITPTGRFDAALVPATDGAIDLGTSSLEYKDLYIDGTAHIDTLDVDINATVAGTLGVTGETTLASATVSDLTDNRVVIAGTSGALEDSGNLTFDGSTLAVTGAGTVSGNATVGGNLDINGSAHDIAGQLTLANPPRNSDGGVIPQVGAIQASGHAGLVTAFKFTGSGLDSFSVVSGVAQVALTGVAGTTYTTTQTVTASQGQTAFTFTSGYSNGFMDCYLNGSRLITGTDYTQTDGNTVTLASGATVGDELEMVAFKSLGNVVSVGTLQTAGALTVTGATTLTGALDANGGATIDNIQIGVTGDNEIDTASGNLTIDSAGGTTTLDDNVIVSGNLTVNGTQTIINSTTVTIDDKNFQVATGAADDAAANGAGFTVDSGDGDKTWNFEATGDNWGSSENINAASGKVYKINNASVLSATTLGGSVVNSSLTSVGTLATGVWNGTAINDDYIGTIDNANKVALSAVDIDGGTDIGEDLVDADEVIVDNGGGGTNRRSDLSRVKKYIYSAASGDATASDAGAITLAASGVSAGTVGSSTAIPILTIDAKGRVTNTSTTAIDQTSIAQGNSSITVADTGTGTATVTIDGATHSTFAAAGITLSQGAFIGNLTGNASGSSGSCTGNSATATEATNVTVSANNATNETVYPLFVDGATGTQGAETDTGFTYNPSTGALTSTSFVGNLTGNVTGNTSGSSGSCTGNAATATALASARTLGGVSFDGTANINLPGVNATGDQDTTGNAATATVGTTITVADESSDTTCFPLFATGASGNLGAKSGTNLTFNSSSGALSATSFVGSGSGLTAGTTPLTTLDIDGGSDIGAGLADADLFIVDDGAGGTNKKTAASRIKTYIADVTLTTASQPNITALGTIASLVASSAKVSDLTSGRVVLAGTSGEIEDSGNLTFNGSTLAVTGNITSNSGATLTGAETTMSSATVSDLTDNRVVVAGSAGALEDSNNLTFDGSTLAVTGAATVSSNLTVSGNLTVNGTTSSVNTVNTTIEDTLLDLQVVDGGALSADTNKDVGIVMNYYSGSAKKAAFYWDDSAGRFVVSAVATESAGVLTNSTAGGFEIGSLYLNDCAGTSQVISCSGTTRSLDNITIDGGTF